MPSFDMVLSIGAVLLLAIWPNILPLQQHFAMAQIIPGVARVPTFGSASHPYANTTAAAGAGTEAPGSAFPANTTAAAGAGTEAPGSAFPANTTAAGAGAEAPANTTAAPHPRS
jgi:hypothetical protein